jgi:hypothetical protein
MDMDAEISTVYAIVLYLTQPSYAKVFVEGHETGDELRVAAMLNKLNDVGGSNVLFFLKGIDALTIEHLNMIETAMRWPKIKFRLTIVMSYYAVKDLPFFRAYDRPSLSTREEQEKLYFAHFNLKISSELLMAFYGDYILSI